MDTKLAPIITNESKLALETFTILFQAILPVLVFSKIRPEKFFNWEMLRLVKFDVDPSNKLALGVHISQSLSAIIHCTLINVITPNINIHDDILLFI
jgi:hypothetical protein